MAHGLACGNDPDAIPSPCVNYHKNSPEGIHSDGNIALLAVFNILKSYGVWIFEGRK
jgi:hypothetical protein